MKLTSEQKEVVAADVSARMVVEAVPGSGKTEVLAWRLARLIKDGLSPSHVMVLSFSNAAVRTLVTRLRKVAKSQEGVVDDLRHVSVRTFDSWAFRLLAASGRPAQSLLRRSYDDNIIAATEALRAGESARQVLSGVKHVFIDEVQDLTGNRSVFALELLKCLSAQGSTFGFTLLGDKHQGIYGFSAKSDGAGLGAEFLEEVSSEWSAELVVKRLTVNHRLAEEMLSASLKARKALEAARGAKALEGIRKIVSTFPVVDSAVEEPSGSSAVLCRTNAQALLVADSIWGREDSVEGAFPYLNAGDQIKAAPPWISRVLSRAVDLSEITHELFVQAYDQLLPIDDRCSEPSAAEAWVFLQKCLRSSPDSRTLNLDTLRERLSWLDFLPDDVGALPETSLEITTIHQSKGREYDNVVLLSGGLDDSRLSDDELREEARVIYVGMTRSRRFVKVWMPTRNMDMYAKNLWNGRTRLMRVFAGGVSMEAGLRRDVAISSFIDPAMLEADPAELQDYLWSNRSSLVGRKVMLVKVAKKEGQKYLAYYRIFLQQDGKPVKALGAMTDVFREEVQGAHKQAAKRIALPGCIFNLRIESVCSYSAKAQELGDKPHPWSSSGFWMGVSLTGLAFFKSYKNAK